MYTETKYELLKYTNWNTWCGQIVFCFDFFFFFLNGALAQIWY